MELTAEKDFKRKEGRAESALYGSGGAGYGNELVALLQQLSSKCSPCEDCGRRKEGREVGVQTSEDPAPKPPAPKINESFDFLDNLEKTLKVLDGKKH